MSEFEKRGGLLGLETREAEGGKMTAVGYAAVFGETTDIGDYFREIIERGAFSNTLKSSDVRAYFDHDTARVLGRTSSGTLRLREDDKGLAVEIDLPDTATGKEVAELLRRGDLTGMSFGFMVTKQEWDDTATPPTRTIKEVVLREVSIVSEPAYDGTSVALRSLSNEREARAEVENRKHNFDAARRRLSERKARQEAKFRGIN